MVQDSWKALEAGHDYEGDDEPTFREKVYADATKFMDQLQKNPDNAEACKQLIALNESVKAQNREDGVDEMELHEGTIDYEFHIRHYKMAKQYQTLLGKEPTNDVEKQEQALAKETLPKIRPAIERFNEEKGYPLSWNLPALPAKKQKTRFLGLPGNRKGATVEDGPESPTLDGPESPIEIKGEKPDGQPLHEIQELEDDDPEALFVPQKAARRTGGAPGVNEGWKGSGASEQVIVKYGPLNSAMYRLEKSEDLAETLDKTKTPEFTEHRLGDKKNGRRWRYTRRHFVMIVGVAFEDNGFDDPMEELKPKEPGETRRYRPIQIKVKWLINGKYLKTWELRGTVRRLMGSKPELGDRAIYIAAVNQAARYNAFLGGDRIGADRSPSVSPELARLVAGRSPTPDDDNSPFQGYAAWNSKPKSPKMHSTKPTSKTNFLGPNWLPANAPASVLAPGPGQREFERMQAQLDGMSKMMEKLLSRMDDQNDGESLYDFN